MKITKKQIIWFSILIIIVTILVIVYYIGKSYGWFALFESKENLQSYVSSFGTLAPLIFFVIQFVQVIISPIPGSITTIAGGMLFGFGYGFLISLAAIFLGSVCAFLLGKKFGRPLVERIAGKDKIEKYMSSVSSRQKIVLFLMFLMPFFPDDILCLIAGLSAMRLPYFSILVLISRPWGLLFSALLGAGIITMPVWGWIIVVIVVLILLVLSIKYAPQIEERILLLVEKITKRFAN